MCLQVLKGFGKSKVADDFPALFRGGYAQIAILYAQALTGVRFGDTDLVGS